MHPEVLGNTCTDLPLWQGVLQMCSRGMFPPFLAATCCAFRALVRSIRLTPFGHIRSCMHTLKRRVFYKLEVLRKWVSGLLFITTFLWLILCTFSPSLPSPNSLAGWSRWSWLLGQRKGSATSLTRDRRWVNQRSQLDAAGDVLLKWKTLVMTLGK